MKNHEKPEFWSLQQNMKKVFKYTLTYWNLQIYITAKNNPVGIMIKQKHIKTYRMNKHLRHL